MSRPLTIDAEARWVARSPVPSGDTVTQLAILDALIAVLDRACVLGWELGAVRLALTLDSDRLAAEHMRRRLVKRTGTAS